MGVMRSSMGRFAELYEPQPTRYQAVIAAQMSDLSFRLGESCSGVSGFMH